MQESVQLIPQIISVELNRSLTVGRYVGYVSFRTKCELYEIDAMISVESLWVQSPNGDFEKAEQTILIENTMVWNNEMQEIQGNFEWLESKMIAALIIETI